CQSRSSAFICDSSPPSLLLCVLCVSVVNLLLPAVGQTREPGWTLHLLQLWLPRSPTSAREDTAMGNWIKLTASDKQQFDGYLAAPSGKPRGGVVVIQET